MRRRGGDAADHIEAPSGTSACWEGREHHFRLFELVKVSLRRRSNVVIFFLLVFSYGSHSLICRALVYLREFIVFSLSYHAVS